MDGSRFDALARTLTTPGSRRVTLKGLVAGAVVALGLDLDETTGPAKKKKKAKKRQSCSTGNPIRCGRFCCRPDETCRAGRCLNHCRDGEKNFGESDVDCGGSCLPVTCGIEQGCVVDADCFTNICEDGGLGGTKQCAQCRTDTDCNSHPGTPRCLEHFCHDCAADFDCPAPGDPPEKTFCIAAAGCPNNEPCVCGSCRQDTDCPPGQVCDEQNRCFECFDDANCAGKPGRPVCIANVCVACARDGDCPTAGDVCIQNACRTPAACPAGGDLCTQGFLVSLACGGVGTGGRCHTTTEGETRCLSALENVCRDQPACTSRGDCEARHGPGAFCVRDTGSFCGCSHCARQGF